LREEEKQVRAAIGRLVGEHLRFSTWDRAEIAAKLGYRSPAQLSKWISGKAAIPPEKLALLADMLNLPVSSFFPEGRRRRPWHDKMVEAISRRDYPAALAILVKEMPPEDAKE
jgi:transcriptional regulator with XRE-family HTH domain